MMKKKLTFEDLPLDADRIASIRHNMTQLQHHHNIMVFVKHIGPTGITFGAFQNEPKTLTEKEVHAKVKRVASEYVQDMAVHVHVQMEKVVKVSEIDSMPFVWVPATTTKGSYVLHTKAPTFVGIIEESQQQDSATDVRSKSFPFNGINYVVHMIEHDDIPSDCHIQRILNQAAYFAKWKMIYSDKKTS